MAEMFCFQCEQTVGGTGCTNVGVRSKKPAVSYKQDQLVCALISLARASGGKSPGKKTDAIVMQSLFATLTNALLSLGINNMYQGPSLPAFISPNVLKVLVDTFNIKPISTSEADMKAAFRNRCRI